MDQSFIAVLSELGSNLKNSDMPHLVQASFSFLLPICCPLFYNVSKCLLIGAIKLRIEFVFLTEWVFWDDMPGSSCTVQWIAWGFCNMSFNSFEKQICFFFWQCTSLHMLFWSGICKSCFLSSIWHEVLNIYNYLLTLLTCISSEFNILHYWTTCCRYI